VRPNRELTELGRRPRRVKRIPFAAVAVAVVAALVASGYGATVHTSGDSFAGPPSPAELDRMARAAVAKWEPILAARGTARVSRFWQGQAARSQLAEAQAWWTARISCSVG
jgi:hypothetical protein